MDDTVAQTRQAPCTKRNSEWWWVWLRQQLEWLGAVRVLQEDGAITRRHGLPWRELAPHELERLAGDQPRARRYAQRGRRLEKVLPPNLRPLVGLAVAGGTWLPVEIPPSRSLDEADVQRLQDVCLRTLNGEKIGRTDGQWRDRKLRSIDPPHPVHVTASVGDLSGPVAVHATALDDRRIIVGASQAGWLPVGDAATSPYSWTVGFRPTFSFSKEILQVYICETCHVQGSASQTAVGSFVWHVREASFEGPELASAYRYHPFSVDEPHVGTDDVFLEGAGPWRVIDFRRTDVLESDGNILVVERASAI